MSLPPMVPALRRVASRRCELADTVTLGLERAEGVPPAPGQFHMLWAFGVGEVPISVSRVGEAVVEHTVRDVGAVTRALTACQPGDVVGVRGPFGVGWDLTQAAARDVVIVAGGLGLAPLRPAFDELLAERERYRRVALLVGARTPDALLFGDELASWRGRFDLDVAVTVDAADSTWRGEVGVVTKLIERVAVEPAETTALVCGPEVMMHFAVRALLDRGVPAERLQLSLERNMACAVGHCGHCQLGPLLLCKDGPVVRWPTVEGLWRVRER